MLLAEELEKSALPDTVNVTSCFLHALQRDGEDGSSSDVRGGKNLGGKDQVPAGWQVAQNLRQRLHSAARCRLHSCPCSRSGEGETESTDEAEYRIFSLALQPDR